jgi:hypothetical protein
MGDAWSAPCLVDLPCHAQPAAWLRPVASPGTIAVPYKWSPGLTPHCSRLSACLAGIKCVACLHVLQALNALLVHTSCRPMMTLASGVLQTCVRALGTCEPSCTGRLVRLFFMFEARGPQRTARHVVARSPPDREARFEAAGHAAHQSPPSGSGATIHMVAPEPFLSGRWVLEPLDT